MTWFKVDDSFHSHPKVLAAPPAALGLWVIAGSWSGANLSDGFVPDHVLPRLLPDAASLARELVTAGLWKRTRGGYRFHDWSDFNPAAEAVLAEREAARERMRAVRERRKQGTTKGDRNFYEQSSKKDREIVEESSSNESSPGQSRNGSGEQLANVRQLFAHPDPTRPEGSGGLGRSLGDTAATRTKNAPPSPQCEKHDGVNDPPPCGPCGDARRARTRWDIADAERRRTSLKCRSHRGQPADNCGLCRSEALAGQEIS